MTFLNFFLRFRLPQVFHNLLPKGSERSQQQPLLPNRGEILEFNRQVVPLSRPLFDGFGLDVSSEKGQKESSGRVCETMSCEQSAIFFSNLVYFPHISQNQANFLKVS